MGLIAREFGTTFFGFYSGISIGQGLSSLINGETSKGLAFTVAGLIGGGTTYYLRMRAEKKAAENLEQEKREERGRRIEDYLLR